MMKSKFNIPGWQWIVAAVVFFVAVLTLQQYILYDMEQARVFVYEGNRIMEQVMRVGGIADLIALFLQQFFLFSVASAAIMAILLVLVSVCLNKVYGFAVGRETFLAEKAFCTLPAALLFVYTEGKIFFITGHVAILLSSVALLAGACLANKKSIIAYAFIPVVVLFTGFAASTAVWPMVAALTIYALLYRKNYIAAGVTVASAVVMVALARYACLAFTTVELTSPDVFSYRLQIPTTMSWVWATMVAVVIVPFIIKKFVSEKIVKHISVAFIMIAVVVGITSKAYKAHHDDDTYMQLRLQRWVDTGEYAKAMDFCGGYMNNIYIANNYFMMYSQSGNIENEVGGILQHSEQLVMPGSSMRHVRRHLMTLYYYIGYVNGAQREAFEYNEPSEGMMMPAAVKILALTNIIQGNYAAAEKYLGYLDRTLFYSDWAKGYRRFLYNDKAVEKDPELGPRRKAMEILSVPQSWTTVPRIIAQIASVCPDLPAENYKKAYSRLGTYNVTNYEIPRQSYIQY